MSIRDKFDAAAVSRRQMELAASARHRPARPRHADAQPDRPALFAADRRLHRGPDVRHRLRRSASFAGFKGKWWDTVIMRITDAQLSIPMIILAITILGVSRPTRRVDHRRAGAVGLAALCPRRPQRCRDRARQGICPRRCGSSGACDWRILLLFAAPNILPPIAFVAVLDVARMMIFEAILGFLGLGDAAADAELRQHHRRFAQISAQCVVDRHQSRRLPRRRADVDQSDGVGAREGPQPDLRRRGL